MLLLIYLRILITKLTIFSNCRPCVRMGSAQVRRANRACWQSSYLASAYKDRCVGTQLSLQFIALAILWQQQQQQQQQQQRMF